MSKINPYVLPQISTKDMINRKDADFHDGFEGRTKDMTTTAADRNDLSAPLYSPGASISATVFCQQIGTVEWPAMDGGPSLPKDLQDL